MALAKTTRPTQAAILVRPRLVRRLDLARRKPVTWVWAPPGAGKTTLVANYLAARKTRGLWYQVDEGDADVTTFFYYLGLAAPPAAPAPADARVPVPRQNSSASVVDGRCSRERAGNARRGWTGVRRQGSRQVAVAHQGSRGSADCGVASGLKEGGPRAWRNGGASSGRSPEVTMMQATDFGD
jgi:hypothetical protein